MKTCFLLWRKPSTHLVTKVSEMKCPVWARKKTHREETHRGKNDFFYYRVPAWRPLPGDLSGSNIPPTSPSCYLLFLLHGTFCNTDAGMYMWQCYRNKNHKEYQCSWLFFWGRELTKRYKFRQRLLTKSCYPYFILEEIQTLTPRLQSSSYFLLTMNLTKSLQSSDMARLLVEMRLKVIAKFSILIILSDIFNYL